MNNANISTNPISQLVMEEREYMRIWDQLADTIEDDDMDTETWKAWVETVDGVDWVLAKHHDVEPFRVCMVDFPEVAKQACKDWSES